MPMEAAGKLSLSRPAASLGKSVAVSDSQERISEEEQSYGDTVHVSNVFQAVEIQVSCCCITFFI